MNPTKSLIQDLKLRSTISIQRSLDHLRTMEWDAGEQKIADSLIKLYNTELNRRRNG